MRVVEGTRYQAIRSQVGALQTRLDQAARELSSGRSVQRSSDAPSSAALAQRFAAAAKRTEAFAGVAERMVGELEIADNALATAGDYLNRGRELANQFGSGAWNDAAWQGAAQTVSEIRDGLLNAANTKVGSVYVFGGTRTDAPPYADDGTYQGGATARTVEVQRGTSVSSIAGPEAFGAAEDVFALVAELETAVANRDDDALRAIADRFGEAFSQTLAAREHAGRGVNVAEEAQRFGEVMQEQYLLGRSGQVDADFADAATRLQQSELALQYAVQVAATREDLDVLRRL